MSGETDLARLLAGLKPRLADGVFVYLTLPAGVDWPAALDPLLVYREEEGTTLVADRERALALGLTGIFPCRRITLEIHSSLEAVGFLAAIATELAKAGIGVNPVAGYFHDHLFVPQDRADEAVARLEGLAARYATGAK